VKKTNFYSLKNVLTCCILALVFTGFIHPSLSQDFEKVQISTVKVSENISMLSGGGGNIGVFTGTDGILLIDSQFGQLYEKITASIEKISAGEVKYLLNTNWHYDHVMGNEAFAKSGAVIIAHENTKKRMSAELNHPYLNMTLPPYPDEALPVITFTANMTIHFNGEEISVTYIPNAHSDADAVFYFRNENVIHTGDMVFSRGYPFLDIAHGGSINGYIDGVDIILEMINDGTKIIPGHGPVSNKSELKTFRNMLAKIRDRISGLIKEGKSFEEAAASKPTADFDESWKMGMGTDLFIRLIFDNLSKK